MPTYNYFCSNCGDLEIIHSIKDEVHKICPKCNGMMERRISSEAGSNIIFKGDGWPDKDRRNNKKPISDPTVSDDERIIRRKKAMKTLRDHSVKHKENL